jgi:hypothetical protein
MNSAMAEAADGEDIVFIVSAAVNLGDEMVVLKSVFHAAQGAEIEVHAKSPVKSIAKNGRLLDVDIRNTADYRIPKIDTRKSRFYAGSRIIESEGFSV